jgi:hypothetical protein
MNTNTELDNTNNPGVVPEEILEKALVALLQCSYTDLESYDYKMIDGYTDDVKRVLNAVSYKPPEAQAKQLAELIEHLRTEISAISCRYRGDPSYDHDAYWMRREVYKLLEEVEQIFIKGDEQ